MRIFSTKVFLLTLVKNSILIKQKPYYLIFSFMSINFSAL